MTPTATASFGTDPTGRQLAWMVGQMNSDPVTGDVSAKLSPSFLQAVPPAEWLIMIGQLRAQGPWVVEAVNTDGIQGGATLVGAGQRYRLTMSLDDRGRIAGALLKPTARGVAAMDWAGVERRAALEAPAVSILAAEIGPGNALTALHRAGDQGLRPIASMFKLYVLAAVAELDRLRAGSWEAAQSHESLRPYLLEEAYELLDAIEGGDRAELRSELGDVLLQVLFHARIAEDDPADPFTIDDVARTLVAKLQGRVPRTVDDDGNVIGEAERERMWQARKAAERPRESCMDGIVTAMPALALAQKVLGRARSAGLPEGLIPQQLVEVRLGWGEDAPDAELELRGATLAFMAAVREVERRIRAAGHTATPLPAGEWSSRWGGSVGP